MCCNMLLESERLDDLLTNNLHIIQSDEVFSFSLDAVLLAHFCTVPPRGKIVDLCTGNGVIPLLLTTRTKASITGVEIQPRLYDMAKRSVALNELTQQINIVQGDLKHYADEVGHGTFDLVTVNPPYLPANSGERNSNEYVAIARHEMYCTLEDVVRACSQLVRYGGKVALVHRPSRLLDLLTLLRQYHLEPKRMRFVHPRQEEAANMILIEAVKYGKPEVRCLPPLIVYDDRSNYTPELLNIYYGNR